MMNAHMFDEDDIKGIDNASIGHIAGVVTILLLIFMGCVVYYFPA